MSTCNGAIYLKIFNQEKQLQCIILQFYELFCPNNTMVTVKVSYRLRSRPQAAKIFFFCPEVLKSFPEF